MRYYKFLIIALILSGCFKDEVVSIDSLTSGSDDIYTPSDGTIIITNQEELNNFAELGYFYINGGVVASGITDLIPLNNLQGVSRTFEIKNSPGLNTLNGLNNLQNIGGDLIIKNTGIENTLGLEGLMEVYGEIKIYSNDNLGEINGFENLSLAVGIDIDDNASLTKINSFNKVASLGHINSYGNFRIGGCHELTEISGFKELVEISGKLEIIGCNALRSLGVISEIERISNLHIEECNRLQNIKGFNQTEFLGIFELYNCDSLATIEGFSNLKVIENLNFNELPNLKNISYFQSLRSIRRVLGIFKSSIQNLDFLGNIDSVGFYGSSTSYLGINFNDNLTDFCGLKNAVIKSNINFKINGNAYNPERFQLYSEDCMQ